MEDELELARPCVIDADQRLVSAAIGVGHHIDDELAG
jgi:hypothetical protein